MAGIGLSLGLHYECATCGEDSDQWAVDLIPLLLLCGNPYQFCPFCGAEVGEDISEDPEFRTKWETAYEKVARQEFIHIRL